MAEGPAGDALLRVRSLLFVPGGRPEMIAKVPRWSPGVTVVDLEDAVAAGSKDRARQAAVAAIAGPGHRAGPRPGGAGPGESPVISGGETARGVADAREVLTSG